MSRAARQGLLVGGLLALLAAPALAQDHEGHDMGEAADRPSTAADLPVGEAPAPPPAEDNLADRYFPPAQMDRSRRILAREHGGGRAWQVLLEKGEARLGEDETGYGWSLEAWYGGDLNRLVLTTEGEGARGGAEHAEIQLLYARAVGPYTDIRLGLRQDIEPVSRSQLAVGVETLLPYWIEVEATGWLSDRGELTARLETHTDFRLTQKLILQPSAEIGLSAQDSPALETGEGLTGVEAGLRLRYEVRREWAPYIGLTWMRSLGDTADYRRAAGEEVDEVRVVVGLRAWF